MNAPARFAIREHAPEIGLHRRVERVAFHEITTGAVRRVMVHPRARDMDLVRARQVRRPLDYRVGFGLSPVLWRKVPECRSAGPARKPGGSRREDRQAGGGLAAKPQSLRNKDLITEEERRVQ